MKNLLFFFTVLITGLSLGQVEIIDTNKIQNVTYCGPPYSEPKDLDSLNGEPIYRFVDSLSTYPKGIFEFQNDVIRNMNFYSDGTYEGKVFAELLIDKTGAIIHVKIVKGIDTEFDDEVIRVIKALPKWNPAVYKGRKVNSYFVVPIHFKY